MEIKPAIFYEFLILCITIIYTSADENKLKLVLDKLDKVKDSEHIIKTDITFDKVNDEEVKINGQLVQSVDLDNEYKLNVNILHSTEQDGEYKKVFGFPNMGVCQVMANQYKKYFYDTLKNYSNAPDPDKCPVTKETYIVNGYPLDSSKFQKYLRPGFYKIVNSLMHQDEEVLQYTVEAHTEEE